MTTQTYQDAAYHLLAQAESELAAGDTRQAAEKGWGAAAQAVKAASEQRGWTHDSHRLLHRAVARLVEETADEQIQNLFAIAALLHINFYEDWLDDPSVRRALVAIGEFVDLIAGLRLPEEYR